MKRYRANSVNLGNLLSERERRVTYHGKLSPIKL